MGYFVTTLLEILTQAIAGAADMLGTGVLELLTIDIGTEGSVFGKIFGAFGEFSDYFIVLSMAFLAINMFWQLSKLMFSPQECQDTPLGIIGRSIMGGILIYGSKTIILAFENLFNTIYKTFLTVEIDGAAVGAKISFGDTVSKMMENASNGTGTLGLGATLLVFILILTMCWQFAMYIIEVVERYIVLGVLYYMSPLPCSMVGSRATSNIFGAYVRMIGSQLVLMLCNVIFFRLFLAGFNGFETIINDAAFSKLSGDDGAAALQAAMICWAFMMNGILVIGARIDSYLGTLGLNAAQTGRGLGSAIVASALGVKRALSTASGVAHGGYRAGKAVAPHAKNTAGKIGEAFGRGYNYVKEKNKDNAFGKALAHISDSVSNVTGSKAKTGKDGLVTPSSIMNRMDGKAKANQAGEYNGADAAASILKASNMPKDVSGGFDKASFKVEPGGASMKWRDPQTGQVADVSLTPLDKANIDPSRAQGRTFQVTDENGQKRDMIATATGAGADAFATSDAGMAKEMKEFASRPGCTATEVAPGVWHTTETNPETGAVTAKEYANASVYRPNIAGNSTEEQHGSSTYHVSDISAPAGGHMTVDNPAAFASGVSPKDFGSHMQSEFGQGSSFDFSTGQAAPQLDGGLQFTTKDGRSYVAAPTAMYDLSQKAQAEGTYRDTITAKNGAQYSVVEVQAGSGGKDMFEKRPGVKRVTGTSQNMGVFATQKFTADDSRAQFLYSQNPYAAQAQARKSSERGRNNRRGKNNR